jgi:hypothetical protein
MNLTPRFSEWVAPMPPTGGGNLRARLVSGVFWALVMVFILSILAFFMIVFQPDLDSWLR